MPSDLTPEEPNRRSLRRFGIGAVSLALLGGAVTAGVVLTSDDDADKTVTADGTGERPEPVVVSAAAGAEARGRQARFATSPVALAMDAEASDTGATSAPAAEFDMIDPCISIDEPWEPSAEDIAANQAETDALAAVMTTYGISHEIISEEFGFTYVAYDYDDLVAQAVADSFYNDLYPVEPIPQEDLDRMRLENDGLAAALDAAGVTYTRTVDEGGWEYLEWDYENPAAQEAVDAYYTELYPPQPPSADELARIQSENDKLMEAFDAAGVAYVLMADEVGWEWLEWDYEVQDVDQIVFSVYEELYPSEPGCAADISLVDGADMPAVDGGPAVDEVFIGDTPDIGDAIVPDASGPATSGVVEPETVDAVEITEPEPEPEPADAPPVMDEPAVIEPIEEYGSGFDEATIAQREAEYQALIDGFTAAGVTHESFGESPWFGIIFDIDHPDAPDVVAQVLASRG